MGDVKNLQHEEAVQKLQDVAGDVKICMFCTYKPGGEMEASPMTTQKVDDEGNVWFISDKNSDRNQAILQNKHVDLLYAHPGKETFVSIHGSAEIMYDQKVIDEMWSSLAKAWFKEGKDDPNVSIIKVKPVEGKYWDTKNGKMVSFLKMIASVVSDKTMDGGIEGKLKVQ